MDAEGGLLDKDEALPLLPVDSGRDRIICEIVDESKSTSLLSSVGCTGYVLSHRIVSNYIAQIAENPLLLNIFSEVLQHTGNEFFLREVEDYISVDAEPELCFWDMVLRVRDHGELLIGYKAASVAFELNDSNKRELNDSNKRQLYDTIKRQLYDSYNQNSQVWENNPANKSTPRKWSKGDVLIVLAPFARERTRRALLRTAKMIKSDYDVM
jgi:hypothetical protein